MESTERRMVIVAVLVCGFAIGMACLLNYFKFRSTEQRLVNERLLVTGRSIEAGIQSALAMGLSFSDIGTLPATLERERATDPMISGIDIFDTDGRMMLSTDSGRASRPVPARWLEAVAKSDQADWSVRNGEDTAAGMAIQNHIGLKIGYLAIRYSHEKLEQVVWGVAQQLAWMGLAIFAAAAALSSLCVLLVTRRLRRDVLLAARAIDETSQEAEDGLARAGQFQPLVQRVRAKLREADAEVAALEAESKGRAAA